MEIIKKDTIMVKDLKGLSDRGKRNLRDWLSTAEACPTGYYDFICSTGLYGGAADFVLPILSSEQMVLLLLGSKEVNAYDTNDLWRACAACLSWLSFYRCSKAFTLSL